MRVAITSYTGEYASALIRALMNADCWVRVVDAMTFEDGFTAGRNVTPVGGPLMEQVGVSEDYMKAQITPPSGEPYVYEGEIENGVSVLILAHGTDEQLAAAARRFAEVLQTDAMGEYCGDDQHFDYYPDGMLMLHQLCRAIGLKGLWLMTRQLAWDSHWKDDGEHDTISQWLPTWEGVTT